jgi:hypothetical protein
MQIRGTHHSEKSLAYKSETTNRPSRAEVEQAVSTLIRWAGDDPDREGLIETPARVARAYEQWFAGYGEDPEEFLQRTFEEVAGYDEMVAFARHPFRVPLRAPHGADHRACPYRLSPAQPGRGNFHGSPLHRSHLPADARSAPRDNA